MVFNPNGNNCLNMKKITLLLLLTLSVLGLQAQTYQLNYDSIRVGKTAGTGGTSLYGKVYLKNVGLGSTADSILTVVNGRVKKIATLSVNLKPYSKNSQSGMSVVDMHYGALRGKGMTSGETPGLTYTVSGSVSAGATSITLSSVTGLVVQQLLAYLGTDGQYYSTSIVSIAGSVVNLAAPTEAAIGTGVNVFSFYANESHASVYGYRAIADYIVRTNKTQYVLESRAQMTSREGGTLITSHNLNNLANPGSGNVMTSSVTIPTANADELRTYFKVKSTGNYVAQLTMNTLGVDVVVSAYYNGGRIYQDTINNFEPLHVNVPMPIYDDLSTISIGMTALVNGANFLVNTDVPILKVTGVAPDLTSGKIVLLGDSWFELPGIYERLVDQLPGSIIVNKGVGGNRAETLVNRFDADVKPENPDVVMIVVGTNDYYRPDALVEFTLGINRLKQKCAEIGAHMILLTSSVGSAELDTARFNLSRQYANFTKMYNEDIPVITSLGDLTYGDTYGYPVRLAGNITTTKKYLTQTGNSTISAAPVWDTIPAPTVYVSQTITDGVTDYAPSENAVFDALALKAPLESPGFTGTGTIPTLNLNGGPLTLGADGTYGSSYSTIGFNGSRSNGANKIIASSDGSDGIYIAAATGRSIYFWPNGGTASTWTISSTALTATVPVIMPANSTAVTASANDNSTKVATTAYVDKFNLASGTYTPTITGVSNLSSSTAVKCHYIRVGNEVTVTGRFTISTTTSSNASLRISLPIASDLASTGDLSGSGSTVASALNVYVVEDTTNNNAEFQIATDSTTLVGVGIGFTFTYTVL